MTTVQPPPRQPSPLVGAEVLLLSADHVRRAGEPPGYPIAVADYLAGRGATVRVRTFQAAIFTTRARRPDLVVAVVPCPGQAAIAAVVAVRYRRRLVIVVRPPVTATRTTRAEHGRRLLGCLMARIERRALARADQVAVLTRTSGDAVRAAGVPSHRIHLLGNGSHVDAGFTADGGGRNPDGDRALLEAMRRAAEASAHHRHGEAAMAQLEAVLVAAASHGSAEGLPPWSFRSTAG
ncbi:MAG TPA: glycosyltransferase [Kineosporiaceae bacterium]|nr:glycosyltransferase [Kineosporiaceae bacterium]